mgnify:CR=1 FL=1
MAAGRTRSPRTSHSPRGRACCWNTVSIDGHDQAAVENLTRQLLNKVLHAPTSRLREAAADGRESEITEAARYLFGLEHGPGLEDTTDEG